jgi:hypothetical protein
VAVALPAFFAWWLHAQTPVEDLAPGEAAKIRAATQAFAAAWVVFLILFNVTVALFLWFRRSS